MKRAPQCWLAQLTAHTFFFLSGRLRKWSPTLGGPFYFILGPELWTWIPKIWCSREDFAKLAAMQNGHKLYSRGRAKLPLGTHAHARCVCVCVCAKHTSDIGKLVTKIWHLHGEIHHDILRTRASYPLEEFAYKELLAEVSEGLGKRATAMLLSCRGMVVWEDQSGRGAARQRMTCWFLVLDDPDDVREIESLIRPEHGFPVDEVTLQGFPPNQIKKLFDLEKLLRVRCRHFNASIPARCRRIFCTNSSKKDFYLGVKR